MFYKVEDEDYDKYALDIRVQFRSHAEAQTLNAHVQSGGVCIFVVFLLFTCY